ncbi:MAG: DedA family protein [Pseudomonadota bacterium]
MVGNPSFLDTLILFLTAHSELFIYFALFSILVLAGVGLLLPEEITLLGGGLLAYGGFSNLTVTIIACFLGIMIGDFIIFSLGRKWGNDIIKHRYLACFISVKRLNRAQKFFKGHGMKTVFIARFVPGFRAVTFATAGTLKMKASYFITINSLAAMISVPLLVSLGYLFAADVDMIVKVVKRVDALILISVTSVIGLAAAYFWLKKRKKSSQ